MVKIMESENEILNAGFKEKNEVLKNKEDELRARIQTNDL